MTSWAPVFAVVMGIGRDQLESMSVPVMVDHLDYAAEMRGGHGG